VGFHDEAVPFEHAQQACVRERNAEYENENGRRQVARFAFPRRSVKIFERQIHGELRSPFGVHFNLR
jgi:hypothetical protein